MWTWDMRMGTIELAIPKIRSRDVPSSLLQPRRGLSMRSGRRASGVRDGASRKVDDLTRAIGCTASRSRSRLDVPQVRVDGRVISQATVVAARVTSTGERQVLGIDVGPSEDRVFWTAFLRSFV
jgi:transposase-like protein